MSQTASEKGAAIAGVRAKDTMKIVQNGVIKETVDRESLWMIQTPQAFRFDLIKEAEDVAEKVGFLGQMKRCLLNDWVTMYILWKVATKMLK